MNKAFVSDIDGTLFFHYLNPPIKKSDIDAIKEFQNQDNLFGLCSGRPYCGVVNLFDNQIKPDFYIISSGALILDQNKKIIYEQCINYKYIQEIYNNYYHQAIVIIQTDNPNNVYKSQKENDLDENTIIIKNIDGLKEQVDYQVDSVSEAIEIFLK